MPVRNPSLKPSSGLLGDTSAGAGVKAGENPDTLLVMSPASFPALIPLGLLFDQTTELRIDRVVMIHRAMALFMGCC